MISDGRPWAHTPVLLQAVLAALAVEPDGIYVDCTVGGAGHSAEIVKKLGPSGRLIGLDQDPAALAAAARRLAAHLSQVSLIPANFRELDRILMQLGIAEVQGILFDLGVSSHQLDTGERGFTFRAGAPLDMRMNPAAATSAADIINTFSESDLAAVIKDYGEERFARRIAKAIAVRRGHKPITTTGELAELIKDAIPAPARRQGPHPARRTFQALRIAVNDELGALSTALDLAVNALGSGGRLAVISFHSLEDRIVKQRFAAGAKGCTCPPKIPICICKKQPELRLVGKQPLVPTPDEVLDNPRSRSAKLRVAEKLPHTSKSPGGNISC